MKTSDTPQGKQFGDLVDAGTKLQLKRDEAKAILAFPSVGLQPGVDRSTTETSHYHRSFESQTRTVPAFAYRIGMRVEQLPCLASQESSGVCEE